MLEPHKSSCPIVAPHSLCPSMTLDLIDVSFSLLVFCSKSHNQTPSLTLSHKLNYPCHSPLEVRLSHLKWFARNILYAAFATCAPIADREAVSSSSRTNLGFFCLAHATARFIRKYWKQRILRLLDAPPASRPRFRAIRQVPLGARCAQSA
jgi:hypothetical protein